jgi:GGDEF domain-containing protein
MVLLNNRLTFDTYFVALVGTCLRFDRRIALIAGLTAIAQFLGSVFWVAHHFDIAAIGDVAGYGRFQWSDQFSRVVLLGAVTGINVFIVSGLQQQRRLSNADALTGAFNRRFLEHYLRHELARARSSTANVTITVSAGVASWPEDGQGTTELVSSADRRMYEAKRRGRNLVVGAG